MLYCIIHTCSCYRIALGYLMPYGCPTAQDKFTNMILCKDRVNQHDHIKQTKQVQYTFH